jgi:hypothetical protein
VSRPASVIGNILDLGPDSGSQRSFFAPWDDAGPTSSALGPAEGSERISVDRADVRLRSRSRSADRGDSFIIPGDVPMSPSGDFGRRSSQPSFDEYILDGWYPPRRHFSAVDNLSSQYPSKHWLPTSHRRVMRTSYPWNGVHTSL